MFSVAHGLWNPDFYYNTAPKPHSKLKKKPTNAREPKLKYRANCQLIVLILCQHCSHATPQHSWARTSQACLRLRQSERPSGPSHTLAVTHAGRHTRLPSHTLAVTHAGRHTHTGLHTLRASIVVVSSNSSKERLGSPATGAARHPPSPAAVGRRR